MSSGRRRRRGDAGVNQSAFVALLVAVILVITTSLVAFGPVIGRTVADYLICQLLQQDTTNCANRPMNPDGNDQPGDPGDTVISFGGGDDPIDPSVCDEIADQQSGSDSLSQDVQDNLHDFPLQTDPLDIGGDFMDWDGEISCGPDGISVTIPEDEVHADLWGWVIQVVAGTSGVLAGWLAEALCVASLSPAAVIACGMIRGYVTTFVWVLVASLLGGQSIKDPMLWAQSLAGGILGAAGGAIYTKWLKGWVDGNAEATLQKVADAIGNFANKTWSGAKAGLLKVKDYIVAMKPYIVNAFHSTARALGYE